MSEKLEISLRDQDKIALIRLAVEQKPSESDVIYKEGFYRGIIDMIKVIL